MDSFEVIEDKITSSITKEKLKKKYLGSAGKVKTQSDENGKYN